jgi:hypothetical protein
MHCDAKEYSFSSLLEYDFPRKNVFIEKIEKFSGSKGNIFYVG